MCVECFGVSPVYKCWTGLHPLYSFGMSLKQNPYLQVHWVLYCWAESSGSGYWHCLPWPHSCLCVYFCRLLHPCFWPAAHGCYLSGEFRSISLHLAKLVLDGPCFVWLYLLITTICYIHMAERPPPSRSLMPLSHTLASNDQGENSYRITYHYTTLVQISSHLYLISFLDSC